MAEIKHTFTAGRMNKDLDERLVPNGEYRDAQNIQVRTTDGDAAGTVQNLQGNKVVGSTNYKKQLLNNHDFSEGSDGWVEKQDSFSQNLLGHDTIDTTDASTSGYSVSPFRTYSPTGEEAAVRITATNTLISWSLDKSYSQTGDKNFSIWVKADSVNTGNNQLTLKAKQDAGQQQELYSITDGWVRYDVSFEIQQLLTGTQINDSIEFNISCDVGDVFHIYKPNLVRSSNAITNDYLAFKDNNLIVNSVNTSYKSLGSEMLSNNSVLYESGEDPSWTSVNVDYSSSRAMLKGGLYSSLSQGTLLDTQSYEVKFSAIVRSGYLTVGSYRFEEGVYLNQTVEISNFLGTLELVGTKKADLDEDGEILIEDHDITVTNVELKPIVSLERGINDFSTKDDVVMQRGETYELEYEIVPSTRPANELALIVDKSYSVLGNKGGRIFLSTKPGVHKVKFTYTASSKGPLTFEVYSDNTRALVDKLEIGYISLVNISESVSSSKCIGSVNDPKINSSYFMFASDEISHGNPSVIGSEVKYIDYIIEQNVSGDTVNVFNDVFGVVQTATKAGLSEQELVSGFESFEVVDGSKYKPGMVVRFITKGGRNLLKPDSKILSIRDNTITLDKAQNVNINSPDINDTLFEDESQWGQSPSENITFVDISVPMFGLKLNTCSISASPNQPVTLTANNSTLISGNSYKFNYSILSNDGVKDLRIWNGFEDLKVPSTVGAHEINFETPNSISSNQFKITVNDQSDFNYSENLITGASSNFEQSTGGWSTGSISNAISEYDYYTNTHQGYRYRLTFGLITPNLSQVTTLSNLPLEPTTTYEISFKASRKGDNQNSLYQITLNDQVVGFNLTNYTQEFTLTLTTSGSISSNKMKISSPNDHEGVIYIDDIKLRKRSGSQPNIQLNSASLVSEDGSVDVVTFEAPKVLEFNQNSLINNINVIDDLLLWTDGASEPKKINITRCKAGTEGYTSSTKLFLNTPSGLKLASNILGIDSKNLILDGDFPSAYRPLRWVGSNGTTASFNSNSLKVEIVSVGNTNYAFFNPPLTDSVYLHKGKEYQIKADCNLEDSSSAKIVIPSIGETNTLYADGKLSLNFIAKKDGNVVPQCFVTGDVGDFARFSNISLALFRNASDDNVLNEHVTVIKKAPKAGPDIEVISAEDMGYGSATLDGFTGFWDFESDEPMSSNSSGSFALDSSKPFKTGDSLILSSSLNGDVDVEVSLIITAIRGKAIYYRLVSVDTELTSEHENWQVSTNQPLGIFENSFCRLAYRYKYNDGEYSSLSPWSDLIFEPGEFNYTVEEGHNLGMINLAKEIHVTNLINEQTPNDVTSVDLILSSTDSSLAYIVKTINKSFDPEWETDLVKINSEVMHNTLPEDQILRVWDNVPIKAKSQEVVGNRVVYGNYAQGYDIPFTPSLYQSLKSTVVSDIGKPKKSVKSGRTYKVGFVFEDKNGRQTPVLSPGSRVTSSEDEGGQQSSSVTVNKANSSSANRIMAGQGWSSDSSNSSKPENWMEYVRFYVKESSNDYYNLAMDRWYNAEDGNIWVSFSSSDINKISEDSYITLKKTHGSNQPVASSDNYKVLAISKEAPDFIKTVRRIIGSINIPGGLDKSYYEEVDGDLLNLSLNKDLKVNNNDYKSFNSSNSPVEINGKLKVRLVATSITNNVSLSTSFIDVNYFKQPLDTSDDGNLRISKQFGTQANFYKRFVDLGYFNSINHAQQQLSNPNNGHIKYELVSETLENKPEFDGRFFVKINKSEDVLNNVINNGKTINVFESIGTISLGCVSSDIANNGRLLTQQMNPYGYEWGSNAASSFGTSSGGYNPNGEVLANPLSKTAAQYMGGCTYKAIGKEYWDFYRQWHTRVVEGVGGLNAARKGNIPVGGFLDEAQYMTKGPYGGSIPKQPYAFSRSPLASSQSRTNDLMTIAIPSLPMPLTEYSDGYLYMKLFKAGAIFSWSSDPQAVKYRVVSAFKHTRSSYASSGCKPCEEQEDLCKRSSWLIRFERLNGDGEIQPKTGIDLDRFDPRHHIDHDGTGRGDLILYEVSSFTEDTTDTSKSGNEGVWETVPNAGIDQDIYYEASKSIPLFLNSKTIKEFAPIDCTVESYNSAGTQVVDSIRTFKVSGYHEKYLLVSGSIASEDYRAYGINRYGYLKFLHKDGTITKSDIEGMGNIVDGEFVNTTPIYSQVTTTNVPGVDAEWNQTITVTNYDDIEVGATIVGRYGPMAYNNTFVKEKLGLNVVLLNKPLQRAASVSGYYTLSDAIFRNHSNAIKLQDEVYENEIVLPWYNCYSFGNGVESNRIRDDFNAPIIGSGFKASTSLEGYSRENKTNGLIYSGIYNSQSSINNLNEFNAALKITKDLNPSYGPIQALHSRNTDLQVFTEDRVLKILSNKDALYNADGNVNITSTNNVLGQATPYLGDFGISNNPESLTHDQYRSYFVDKHRGAVLRLSRDGITVISDLGMKSWFRDNLRTSKLVKGSFDIVNGEYNVTIEHSDEYQKEPCNLSFNEASKGWVSFKSYIPDNSISSNGRFITTKNNKIWEHYSDDVNRNTFYGDTGLEIVENGTFAIDLRSWDLTTPDNKHLVSRVDTAPYFNRTALLIDGLRGKEETGSIKQDVSSRTNRKTKYKVSFLYYIVAGNLTLDVEDGSEYDQLFENKGEWTTHSFIHDSENKILKAIHFYGQTGRYVKAYVANVSIKPYHDNFGKSKVSLLMNDIPGTIKSFKSINFEGSEGNSVNVANQFFTDVNGNSIEVTDNMFNKMYDDTSSGDGWSASITTDMSTGLVNGFVNKEQKWFGSIVGDLNSDEIDYKSIDLSDSNIQGLGFAKLVTEGNATKVEIKITN